MLPKPLAGRKIWLTRPAHQCAQWTAGLEAAGAQVDIEPLVDIVAIEDEAGARDALQAATQADVIIATSPNAVYALRRLCPTFAPRGKLFAVGDATAGLLAQLTGRAVAVPATSDTSEGLLGMPELAKTSGASVALISGQGGRRKLMRDLSERGATVRKIALYRREMVAIPDHRLAQLADRNSAAVITSGEALLHLCDMLRSCSRSCVRDALARLQLVVPSPRVVQLTPEGLFRYPPRAVARMTVEAVVAVLSEADITRENNYF